MHGSVAIWNAISVKMRTLYLFVVVAIAHATPILATFERLPNFWVKRFFQQKSCVPTQVLATCNMMRDPAAPFTVSGKVDLIQIDYCGFYLGSLRVMVNLKGFPKSRDARQRGFHVHQFGDLSAGCTSAGGHYNPYNMTHGAPNDAVRHVGDFGNIPVNSDGTVTYAYKDRVASLIGRNTIIGRTIVVHAGTDDLGRGGDPESKKTGNAGARLACCVIGRSQGTEYQKILRP